MGGTFFERVFGFKEGTYASAHAWFTAHSARDTDGSWFITTSAAASSESPERRRGREAEVGVVGGRFETPSLAELRATAAALSAEVKEKRHARVLQHRPGVSLEHAEGHVGTFHEDPQYAGAVFQAASQFNCLEMVSPAVTPERGITCYRSDPTQGPACAIACAAGTAVRNYLAPMPDGQVGQTGGNQIDTMAECHRLLIDKAEGRRWLWKVRNGYIESSAPLLAMVNRGLRSEAAEVEAALRIGVQWGTEVCRSKSWVPQPRGAPRHLVTQTYNSAISVGYSNAPDDAWEPLARAVLRATYEATLLVGVITNARLALAGLPPKPVLLSKVGGGVFRNKAEWIADAIAESIRRVEGHRVRLPLVLVHFGACESAYLPLATPMQRSDTMDGGDLETEGFGAPAEALGLPTNPDLAPPMDE